jgi:hypothetical protein
LIKAIYLEVRESVNKYVLVLWMIIIGIFLTGVAFADHNSHYEGYSDERGYNRSNCEALYSKETGKQAEWLGHYIGCLVKENKGYILIMEYRVEELSEDSANKLRELVEEHSKRGEWM